MEETAIRHLAGLAEIVDDVEAAVRFYRQTLGLEVEYEPGSAYASVHLPGVLHFGLWARAAAAETLYGNPAAIDRVPLGFTVGFEVDDVAEASQAAAGRGLAFVQEAKTEPWGQSTSRFLSPGGALLEFSQTPWARRIVQNLEAEGD